MSVILIKGQVYCALAGHPIYVQSGAPGEVAAHHYPFRSTYLRRSSLSTSKRAVRSGTRIERSRNSRNRNRRGSTESLLQIRSHSRSRVASRGRLDSNSGGIRGVFLAILEAFTGAIGALAGVDLVGARLGPHSEILDGHVLAGRFGGALDLDRAALGAVSFGSLPVLDCDVGQLDAVAGDFAHAAPGAVDVEGVGVAVTYIY